MDTILTQTEKKNKRKGFVTSLAIHLGLFLLFLLPFLTYPDPPPGQEGILVNLGIPDVGEGVENAPPAEPEESVAEPVVEEVPEEEEEQAPEPQPKPEPIKEVTPQKEVITTDIDEVKIKEMEKEKKRQEEAEKKRQEIEAKKRAEEIKKKKAQEAEKKKREEEARKKAEADAQKNKIGGLFGDGDGKGNTGTPGNQGDPGGDPNSDVLEGISTGSGQIGGGLQGRGVVYSPDISDRSQKIGKVVVKVCVNTEGKVIEATYTQKGSTTNDGDLIRIATDNARKFRFSKGKLDKQCGTITIDFKVK